MANSLLNARLRQYLAAEEAVLVAGQSYTIENRTLTRADLAEIREAINNLIAAGATIEEAPTHTGRRARQVIMMD